MIYIYHNPCCVVRKSHFHCQSLEWSQLERNGNMKHGGTHYFHTLHPDAELRKAGVEIHVHGQRRIQLAQCRKSRIERVSE